MSQAAFLPTPDADRRTDPADAVAQVYGRTSGERFKSVLWSGIVQPLLRRTLEDWHGLRRLVLRLFGADIHRTARLSRTVRIHFPWNLSIGEESVVAHRAILFCLGKVRIGKRCRVSQFAHLCAAGHDYTRTDMALVTDPLVLEDDVWIAADVFIGPGVTVGRDSIVGARSSVLHSIPPGHVCHGEGVRTVHPRTDRPGAPGAGPLGGPA